MFSFKKNNPKLNNIKGKIHRHEYYLLYPNWICWWSIYHDHDQCV